MRTFGFTNQHRWFTFWPIQPPQAPPHVNCSCSLCCYIWGVWSKCRLSIEVYRTTLHIEKLCKRATQCLKMWWVGCENVPVPLSLSLFSTHLRSLHHSLLLSCLLPSSGMAGTGVWTIQPCKQDSTRLTPGLPWTQLFIFSPSSDTQVKACITLADIWEWQNRGSI